MEKQNATTSFTYENIYGLRFCVLQTHPLLPGSLRRLPAYMQIAIYFSKGTGIV